MDRFGRVGRGGESPGLVNLGKQFREAGLEQWSLAGAKQREFIGIRFHADHVVFAVGKTNRGDRADVSESQNADFHGGSFRELMRKF